LKRRESAQGPGVAGVKMFGKGGQRKEQGCVGGGKHVDRVRANQRRKKRGKSQEKPKEAGKRRGSFQAGRELTKKKGGVENQIFRKKNELITGEESDEGAMGGKL